MFQNIIRQSVLCLNKTVILLLFGILPFISLAQKKKIANDPVTLQQIQAQTKQLNQFIRRFNGEEDKEGERLDNKDRQYRSLELRKAYLEFLFDNDNITITEESKGIFLDHILSKPGKYLDIHNEKWFAEAKTTFLYEGKERELTIFLNFEQKDLGWHWVISGIYFKPYINFFERPILQGVEVLHPKSHEIDFMTLNRALANPSKIAAYTPMNFSPSLLSIFAYDVKLGRLKFQSVDGVKFHFFQIDNYYFQISEFLRDGYNTGWLISNLVKLPENEKEEFIKLIRYETF